MDTLIAINVAVVLGTIGWLVWNRKRKTPPPEAAKVPETMEADQLKKVLAGSQSFRVKLDETKRKSLQPQNQNSLPAGWSIEKDNHGESQFKMPKVSIKGDFQHKFYGSQFTVGSKTILTNLPRKMHLLEVTSQDIVYVDGVPTQVHPNDLELLKHTIADIQA